MTASVPDDVVSVLAAAGDREQEIRMVLARVERGDLDLPPQDFLRLAALLGHPLKGVRRLAAGALAASLARGLVAARECEGLLAGGSFESRWGAAFALSRAGFADDRILEISMCALDANDGDVRWAATAVVTAAARSSDGVRERLRDVARGGSARERKMALLCLSDSGHRDTTVYLEALRDADALVRIAALTALARTGSASPGVTDAISTLAQGDPEARVRRAASAVVARINLHGQER